MASSYTATDAHAHEHLMGRWSGRLAEQLIAFAGIETGDHVLDVGCGSGSLALALALLPEPAAIVGIDSRAVHWLCLNPIQGPAPELFNRRCGRFGFAERQLPSLLFA